MKTPQDSVARNLEVAVAGLPIANASKLDPDALQKDHDRYLAAAVERVERCIGTPGTAPDEVAPLYDSVEAIASFFGPTGPGRDKQIDVDRAHSAELARAAQAAGTFGRVAPPAYAPEPRNVKGDK